ncbi:hypothetical protein [Candidatus Rariloculus sp.]|uniref:hypothetical protein n=1 Tax=Candidatus Rariloculus sp. TaxID=3101265 RepID=UPI003D12E591
MAGIAPLLASSNENIAIVGSAGVAILVVLDFMLDLPTKISILHSISLECSELEGEWHNLWAECDLEETKDQKIKQRHTDLTKRGEKATSKANIDVYAWINRKTTNEVYQVLRERYHESATQRAYPQGQRAS